MSFVFDCCRFALTFVFSKVCDADTKMRTNEEKEQEAMVLTDTGIKPGNTNTHTKKLTISKLYQLPDLITNLTHFTHPGDETESYYFPLPIGNGEQERPWCNLFGSA